VTALTVRGAQEVKGVPYEWPGRGTRYPGSQRLHASVAEAEAHVAQKQAQDKQERSHLQQEKTTLLLQRDSSQVQNSGTADPLPGSRQLRMRAAVRILPKREGTQKIRLQTWSKPFKSILVTVLKHGVLQFCYTATP
jgi:hypothetical protein